MPCRPWGVGGEGGCTPWGGGVAHGGGGGCGQPHTTRPLESSALKTHGLALVWHSLMWWCGDSRVYGALVLVKALPSSCIP